MHLKSYTNSIVNIFYTVEVMGLLILSQQSEQSTTILSTNKMRYTILAHVNFIIRSEGE